MFKQSIIFITALTILTLCAGCAKKAKPPIKASAPTDKKEYHEGQVSDIISTDTVWEGTVRVDGIIKIAKGARLTIMPGTTVEFSYHDHDKDGLGDGGLLVEGGIIAAGTYEKPILFTSEEGHKESGAWGMILINLSNDVVFDYCRFEYSTYTLHIHFSSGSITNSLFTNNEDGTRIGRSRFFIYNNVFKGNTIKGVNFTDCQNEIKYNTITDNKHGIFLFEGDKGSIVQHNNIYANEIYNFKLGDFFIGDVTLRDNYWGDISADDASQKVYDKKFDETLGTVSISPAATKIGDTGIIKDIKMEKLFEFTSGGYIDSTAAIDETSATLYFGSFDGYLYAIDADSGAEKFRFLAGDIIDSSPAIDETNVYFASWNNNVYCLDKTSGDLKWTYEMNSSSQDDHRQSSPLINNGVLYIGGYDGTVYALDSKSGDSIWKFTTNGAIRSSGVIYGDEIIFGSADGTLYGLSQKDGRGRWMIDLGSPLLSTPLILDDVIFVAAKGGALYAINLATKAKTSIFVNESVNFYAAPVEYNGDVLFATTDNKLYRLKWSNLSIKSVTDINGPAYATPSVYKDFILAPTNLGNLNLIERGNNKRVISYFLANDAIQSRPVIYKDRIYFGSRDNKFYAVTIKIDTSEGF